jgi:tripartite-type tricarboxylate transporter receptor subunit TctC
MTRFTLALLAAVLPATTAQAQTNDTRWPERPIRFIVPFTPGSSSDTVARLVGQKLGERLGQQLVVENRVGGGGAIGTEQVARAEADGYTLGLANTSTHAVAVSTLRSTTDPAKDFAPVSMLGSSPSCWRSIPACR